MLCLFVVNLFQITENGCCLIPFTLRVALENIICYCHSFENNLELKQKFTKYLKKSCCLASDLHFSHKFFPKNAFVRKILSKLSGLFWPLSVNELMLKANARSLACLCIVRTFASGWDLIEFIPLCFSDYRMILIKNEK